MQSGGVSRGGSVAVAVGDSDRRQVTGDTQHMSCDTYIFSPFCLFLAFLVSVLLSAHVKRFSVSPMQDFSSLFNSILKNVHPTFFLQNILHLVSW